VNGEQRLREALRDAPLEDAGARARALRVVAAAYREREPHPARRAWIPAVALATCVLAAGIAVAAVSEPGDAVARWVRSVLGVSGHEDARPALVRVPGGGRLLASTAGGAWVVSADGSRRRLGGYDGASWSPHGLFVVVWRGRELKAVEPDGSVRWALPAPARIRVARWGKVDGFRIAYVAGRQLRIVNGTGSDDRRLGRAHRRVAPDWRPDDQHVVTYADARARVRVVAVDSGRELWRTGTLRGVRELAWSPGGRRLLAATSRRLVLYSRSGRRLWSRALPAGLVAEDVAWAPRGGRLAVVRRGARRSDVTLLDRRGRSRNLFTGPGRFGAVAWSPTGRRLLVPWPEADQWLFLAASNGRTSAVGNIARQFAGGPGRRAFAHTVEWCCAR
jgi:hypothetical protein